MSVLGRFLLKHFALYLGSVWAVLTIILFVLGVIESAMNRFSDATETNKSSVFLEVLRQRSHEIPEYASETMAYAGLVGMLLGFLSLWRQRAFLQCQLLGASRLLWRCALMSGFAFGVLQSTVVETLKQPRQQSGEQVVHDDLQIVRDRTQGGRLVLFAKHYRPHNGRLEGGDVRVLVLDKAFQFESLFVAQQGRINPQAWVLLEGSQQDAQGRRSVFAKKLFEVETDRAALARALQPDAKALSPAYLLQAYRAAHAHARDTKPFVHRAFFLLSLPLFYASFGVLAYALCLILPHRTTGTRMAFFVLLLPCGIEFLRHLAWSRVFANDLHFLLPALGIPIAFICTTGFLVRNERLFS